VRRLTLLTATGCALAAVAAGAAGATNECRGLQVCVPVAGPWVLAPGPAQTQYQLSCPPRFVVAGLDAELTSKLIDVLFFGSLGTPVNPGITTSTSAVFLGRLTRGRDPAASFRPHIGCVPASGGGGQRIPTSLHVYPPGKPTTRRVTEITVRPGATRRTVQRCNAGEQLVGASYAVGFYSPKPPTRALATAVRVSRKVTGGRVTTVVRGSRAVAAVRAVVQVDLVCVGGGA